MSMLGFANGLHRCKWQSVTYLKKAENGRTSVVYMSHTLFHMNMIQTSDLHDRNTVIIRKLRRELHTELVFSKISHHHHTDFS